MSPSANRVPATNWTSKLTYGELDQSKLAAPVSGQVDATLTVGPSSVPVTVDVNATIDFSQANLPPFLDFR